MPTFLATRMPPRAFAPTKPYALGATPPAPTPAAAPTPASRDGLDVDDLLTAWIANAQGVHEPDTLDDVSDYARNLEDRDRAARKAGDLCRQLRERLADWIADQRTTVPGT